MISGIPPAAYSGGGFDFQGMNAQKIISSLDRIQKEEQWKVKQQLEESLKYSYEADKTKLDPEAVKNFEGGRESQAHASGGVPDKPRDNIKITPIKKKKNVQRDFTPGSKQKNAEAAPKKEPARNPLVRLGKNQGVSRRLEDRFKALQDVGKEKGEKNGKENGKGGEDFSR